MTLGVLIKWRKHDRQDDLNIVANKVAEVLIVPEVQRSLRNLEMWAGDRLGELVEKWLLHLGELSRVHHLKDILHLIQKHHFLRAVRFRPVPKESEDNL